MSRKKEPPPQFIAVTADEYELTLGAFDTVKEMCEWSGHKKFAIYQSMENGRILRKGPAKGCKVLRLVNGRYITGVLHPKPRNKKEITRPPAARRKPRSRRSIVVSIQARPPRRTAALFLPALPRSIASGM